jgi:hypothetical protein
MNRSRSPDLMRRSRKYETSKIPLAALHSWQLEDHSVLREKVYDVYEYFRPDVITGQLLAKEVSERAVAIAQNFEPQTRTNMVFYWIYIAVSLGTMGVALTMGIREMINGSGDY